MENICQFLLKLYADHARATAEIFEGIVRGTALTVEVFLHADFGCYYVGVGVGGLIAMFVFFAVLFPQDNFRPMVLFMVIYALRWAYVGICSLIRYWRGIELVHSRYNGRPYLCNLLPEWKELSVKYIEALGAAGFGFAFHYLYAPLGYYLLCASSVVLLRVYAYDTNIRDQAINLNDAVIDQERVAERFREMRPK